MPQECTCYRRPSHITCVYNIYCLPYTIELVDAYCLHTCFALHMCIAFGSPHVHYCRACTCALLLGLHMCTTAGPAHVHCFWVSTCALLQGPHMCTAAGAPSHTPTHLLVCTIPDTPVVCGYKREQCQMVL